MCSHGCLVFDRGINEIVVPKFNPATMKFELMDERDFTPREKEVLYQDGATLKYEGDKKCH